MGVERSGGFQIFRRCIEQDLGLIGCRNEDKPGFKVSAWTVICSVTVFTEITQEEENI